MMEAALPELKQLLLIVAVYPGGRTWDDVLHDLLEVQGSKPDRIQFRLLLPIEEGLRKAGCRNNERTRADKSGCPTIF
jgi:hypothetical protein